MIELPGEELYQIENVNSGKISTVNNYSKWFGTVFRMTKVENNLHSHSYLNDMRRMAVANL